MKNIVLFLVALLSFGSVRAQFKSPGMVSHTYRNSLQKNRVATLDTINALGADRLNGLSQTTHESASIRY